MRVLMEAINVLGALLLQLAVGLLIEELTFGGLARLILAPRPVQGNGKGRKHSGPKYTGEDKCSH